MTEKEARQYAHMRNTEVQQQGVEVLEFPSWLRTSALRCQQQLAPLNKTIEEATRHYLAHLERIGKSITLREAVVACVAAKESAGVTRSYVGDLRKFLGRFRDFTGAEMFVSEVTTRHVNDYLATLTDVGARTHNSVRIILSALFSYVRDNGYCAENPVKRATLKKEIAPPCEILSPEQLAILLASVSPEWVPFLAIGAFAGIRVAEIGKLDWREVDLLDGCIEVTAKNAKSAQRRIVKILPTLDAWIRPLAKPEGRVAPCEVFSPKLNFPDALAKAGIDPWPRNALRHSFASYHIAHFKDAAKLALEMGHNTTKLIFKHYRQVVRSNDAERYWAILPPGVETNDVVNFPPPVPAVTHEDKNYGLTS